MIVLSVKNDPVPQSTSQKFPAAKWAGGRGEALKFVPTLWGAGREEI